MPKEEIVAQGRPPRIRKWRVLTSPQMPEVAAVHLTTSAGENYYLMTPEELAHFGKELIDQAKEMRGKAN